VKVVNCKLRADAVAGLAALAVLRSIDQDVDVGRTGVMAAETSCTDRHGGGGQGGRRRDGGDCSDVVHLVRVVHVASRAIAEVARIFHFLVIGGAQDVGVGQVLAAVGAVNLATRS